MCGLEVSSWLFLNTFYDQSSWMLSLSYKTYLKHKTHYRSLLKHLSIRFLIFPFHFFSGLLCHRDDACISNPCREGSQCDTNPISGMYNCNCPPGYIGSTCQTDRDECSIGGQNRVKTRSNTHLALGVFCFYTFLFPLYYQAPTPVSMAVNVWTLMAPSPVTVFVDTLDRAVSRTSMSVLQAPARTMAPVWIVLATTPASAWLVHNLVLKQHSTLYYLTLFLTFSFRSSWMKCNTMKLCVLLVCAFRCQKKMKMITSWNRYLNTINEHNHKNTATYLKYNNHKHLPLKYFWVLFIQFLQTAKMKDRKHILEERTMTKIH